MFNQCHFIGNLGADPEIKSLQSGRKVANFRLAVSERWKDKQSGEQKERTEWIPVVVFSDGLVGVVERFLRKGSKVYVEGQFRTRKWQAQDGSDRYVTEIVLQGFGGKLVLLDSKREPDGSQGAPADQNDGFDDDPDIPFLASGSVW